MVPVHSVAEPELHGTAHIPGAGAKAGAKAGAEAGVTKILKSGAGAAKMGGSDNTTGTYLFITNTNMYLPLKMFGLSADNSLKSFS